MTKLFTFAAISLLAIGCGKPKEPKEIAKENFETEIKKNLNDASSYEFVEMTDLWPMKGSHVFAVKNTELDLEKSGMDDTTAIAKKRADLDIYKKDPNGVFGYSSEIKIRANNKLGAKIINIYNVHFDKEYKVENIEDNN